MYINCSSAEKLIQFKRLIDYECKRHQSSRFIVYLATCACVDYFYRVSLVSTSVSSDLYDAHFAFCCADSPSHSSVKCHAAFTARASPTCESDEDLGRVRVGCRNAGSATDAASD